MRAGQWLMSLADMFRGYLASKDSPNGGRDVHLGDLRRGILQPASQMGSNVPLVAGMALSFKQRGEDRVAGRQAVEAVGGPALEGIPDRLRDGDLAEVVQQAGQAERAHVARGMPQELADGHREHRHVERVRRRVLVEVAQPQQRQDHLLVRVHRDGQRADHHLGLGQRKGGDRLTGGDPITARFMRQDFFEYTPQFKLVIAGNHKPSIRNVDEAMRRFLAKRPVRLKRSGTSYAARDELHDRDRLR